MKKYVYPAILKKDDDGSYFINFPDFENCYTQGEDLEDALEMAEDVLALVLYDMEMQNKKVPDATDLNEIKRENENDYVTLIRCDTLEYRKLHSNQPINKTLTLPTWLNEEAEKEGIDFSKVLHDALISILNA